MVVDEKSGGFDFGGSSLYFTRDAKIKGSPATTFFACQSCSERSISSPASVFTFDPFLSGSSFSAVLPVSAITSIFILASINTFPGAVSYTHLRAHET